MTEGRPPSDRGEAARDRGEASRHRGIANRDRWEVFCDRVEACGDRREASHDRGEASHDGWEAFRDRGETPPEILRGIGVRSENSWATPDCWSASVQTYHSLEIGSYHNAVRKHHVR